MDSNDSEMELLYETYLSSDDQVIEIEGLTYYKIIKKDFLELGSRNMSLIMIPLNASWMKSACSSLMKIMSALI